MIIAYERSKMKKSSYYLFMKDVFTFGHLIYRGLHKEKDVSFERRLLEKKRMHIIEPEFVWTHASCL